MVANIETDEWIPTDELSVDLPVWVGALAIRQCVLAGEHERDHPSACRTHLIEARRLAAWLADCNADPSR